MPHIPYYKDDLIKLGQKIVQNAQKIPGGGVQPFGSNGKCAENVLQNRKNIELTRGLWYK